MLWVKLYGRGWGVLSWGEGSEGVTPSHRAGWDESAGQGRLVALVGIASGVLENLQRGTW